jgi:diguanylate cyclase (GGDEF)-like protein
LNANPAYPVAALEAFEATLLRARTLGDLGQAAHEFCATHLGLREARLVWDLGQQPDEIPIRGVEPPGGAALNVAEQAVISRALDSPGRTVGLQGSGRNALALSARSPEGWAVLLWKVVGEVAPPSGALWDTARAALADALMHGIKFARLQHAVKRLERAERLQRALFAIADMASSDMDMPEMLRAIHEQLEALMYARNFYLVRYDPEREAMRFVYFCDNSDWAGVDMDREYSQSNTPNSLTLNLLRLGKPLMGASRDLRAQFGVALDSHVGPDSEHWLGVPMISAGAVRGALVVQSYDPAIRFSDEDRVLLSFVAQHVLTALERKQSQAELERRVEERTRALERMNAELTWEVAERQRGERAQAALFRIAELSGTAETLEQFYAAIHAIVGELIDARNFYIALLTDDGGELYYPYFVDQIDHAGIRRRLAHGLSEYVLRTAKPLLADADAIEALIRRGDVQLIGAPAVCWLGVPLLVDDKPVGILTVQSYDANHLYSARDQELLTFVSYHIATALQRKRAQDSLRSAYAELEHRVAERTRELADANRELRDQIGERERAEHRLKHQALHDGLTGLPNRACFLDRLGHALVRYQNEHFRQFAVLFLDLDRFKVINDSVGHLVGDELLKEAGARISHCLRTPDTVARLGGDEFGILIEDIHSAGEVFPVARRVIDSLSEPIRVAGKELFTSASMGIAMAHPRYRRAEELLRDADVAMYRAKSLGRQRYELFDEQLHTEALRLLDLEGDLRRAIARGEFEPHFQSIVRPGDGKVMGYEALLRWRHPERGLLLPGDFLNVAEDNGSVEQIDWQMFDLTCREIPALTREGAYVCINVSARHFRSEDLDEAVLALLRARNIAPRCLRLEVTEGALLENPEHVRRTLQRLREAGVMAQLDDFGTGYSSLSYLHRFPIHSLKVDRSFVSDLRPGVTTGSAAVVRAIVAMASSLGVEVIAEGVETTEQRDALLELGCEYAQGFLYSQPRPAERVLAER